MRLALAPTPETQGVCWVWVSEDLTKPHPRAYLSIPVLSPLENYPSDPFPCLLLPLLLLPLFIRMVLGKINCETPSPG